MERRQNPVVSGKDPVSGGYRYLDGRHRDRPFLDGLTIVDLHADPLLFDRDLTTLGSFGHVDLPRLRVGRVALQVFGAVTHIASKTGVGIDECPDWGAARAWLGWPWGTHDSYLERALHQARRLQEFATRDPLFRIIESRRDLDRLLTDRRTNPDLVGGLLALEGAQALDGDPANLDLLFTAGYRMVGFTHFFDNFAGGSRHGVTRAGLTPFGRDVLRRMQTLGMVVDLAHASWPLTLDVLREWKRLHAGSAAPRVVVSHTGIQDTCPGPRNLTPREVDAIVAARGLIGVGCWDEAVCPFLDDELVARDESSSRYDRNDSFADAVADAIVRLVAVSSADHVAIGSDFNGGVTVGFDVTGIPLIVDALLARDVSRDEIRKIMGDNALEVIRENLPP